VGVAMGGAREAQARQGAAVNNADPSGRSHQEMNRREFFLTWIFQNRSTSTEVEVMEVFAASDGPSAFLVHHASEAARTAFGEWLRANDGTRIVCRLHNGDDTRWRDFPCKDVLRARIGTHARGGRGSPQRYCKHQLIREVG